MKQFFAFLSSAALGLALGNDQPQIMALAVGMMSAWATIDMILQDYK